MVLLSFLISYSLGQGRTIELFLSFLSEKSAN